MRVIKEGKKPPKEIEKECGQCGCVFAYERGDVKSATQYNYTEHYVICPTCKKAIGVDYFPNY